MKEYGTLEPLQEEKRTSRKGVFVVIGVLACVAVLGFATGHVQVNSVVDSNRGRKFAAPVDPAVQPAFQAVCDRAKGGTEEQVKADPDRAAMRFSIAGLSNTREEQKNQYKLVPMVNYKATDDWVNDWKMFKAFMPSDPSVGFGVFNFPVWKLEKGTVMKAQDDFLVFPTFVSYEKVGINEPNWRKLHPTYENLEQSGPYQDLSDKFLGGSFLGSALLAASGTITSKAADCAPNCVKPWVTLPADFENGKKRPCVSSVIEISQKTTYQQACVKVLMHQHKINPAGRAHADEAKAKAFYQQMCEATSISRCPFEGAASPCKLSSCKSVSDWKGDEPYPKECCTSIKAYCNLPAGNGKAGCTKRFERAIYQRNCDRSYEELSTNVGMLKGLTEAPTCDKKCANTCFDFAKLSDTTKCLGCKTNYQKSKYAEGAGGTFVARCFSGAPGFQAMRCCGSDAAKCNEAKQAKGCAEKTTTVMAGKNQKCEWKTHKACGLYLYSIKPNAQCDATFTAAKCTADKMGKPKAGECPGKEASACTKELCCEPAPKKAATKKAAAPKAPKAAK